MKTWPGRAARIWVLRHQREAQGQEPDSQVVEQPFAPLGRGSKDSYCAGPHGDTEGCELGTGQRGNKMEHEGVMKLYSICGLSTVTVML